MQSEYGRASDALRAIVPAMPEGRDAGGKGRGFLGINDRMNAWKELLDVERTRRTIEMMSDEKWPESFTGTKEEMLAPVHARIAELRTRLGLVPTGK